MAKTKITYVPETINPVTGCTKYSAGCFNCYMLADMHRWQGFNPEKYRNGSNVTCHPGVMEKVLKRKKPTQFFVGSMSDLFHRDVPTAFLTELFDIMRRAQQHEFLLLTKRTRRLAELAPELPWPKNIRMGATVESNDYLYRIEHLKQVPAHIRWLSLEPLLTDMNALNAEMLEGIHWIVLGGERGGKDARLMQLDWARYVRDLCVELEIPFFLKQLGTRWGSKNKGGNVLDGQTWEQYPDHE